MIEMVEENDYVVLSEAREGCENSRGSMLVEDLCSSIDRIVESYHDRLWALNTSIHNNSELAFKEYRTHDVLTEFMQSFPGWEVRKSAYGLDTAWVAEYDSGTQGPVVSFNAEMDALPDLGHACGHNLIAIVSVAAGLAAALIMKFHDLSGKVLIFGTPGEEGTGGGKIQLLERGAYKDVDISLISHPGILNNSPLVRTTAFSRLEVEYFGKAAHAARSPWLGANALDALVIAYNAVSVLRQQTMPTDLISMSITDGGSAPNIIHAYASGTCVLRARTQARLEELQDKISACFQSGALATGCKVDIKLTKGYADHVPNHILAASYCKYWEQLRDIPEPPLPSKDQYTYVQASTDQGNLSYHMPSVNASFAIPPGLERGQPHSPDFEKASGTKGAFERALRVAKALAGVAIDVLSVEGLLDEIKKEWKSDMEKMRNGDQKT